MATLTDDLTAEFAATADDILTRLSSDESVTTELDERGFSPRAWSAAAEAGWLEALLTEATGGLGLSLREMGPIFTAAGRHLFVGPLAEHALAAALAASTAGKPAADRITATLTGERRLAFVDPAATRTLAGPRPTLEAGRLRGTCPMTRFAEQADELLVVAAAPGAIPDPVAIVIIERDREGIAVTARPSLDPCTRMARIDFGETEIRDGDLVAGGDDVGRLLKRIRAGLRIAIACELSGIAEHTLGLAVDYAKERHQFGRPIGSFQALQHLLAEMAREAFGLARLCRDSCRVRDDDLELLEEVSFVAKAHASAAARSVIEGSLQVHGGIAFTMEHELHRYYKHLLFLEGLYGDRDEIHRTLGHRLLAGLGDVWPDWR